MPSRPVALAAARRSRNSESLAVDDARHDRRPDPETEQQRPRDGSRRRKGTGLLAQEENDRQPVDADGQPRDQCRSHQRCNAAVPKQLGVPGHVRRLRGYNPLYAAGWSSQVARRAHNPKVAGSNPAPATVEAPANAGVSAFRLATVWAYE